MPSGPGALVDLVFFKARRMSLRFIAALLNNEWGFGYVGRKDVSIVESVDL